MRVPVVGIQNPVDTFVWPTSSPTAVAVYQVVDLTTGESLDCNSSPALLNASGNRHVLTAFDAGEIAFAKEAVSATIVSIPSITDAEIVSKAYPQYPEYARQNRIGGTVVVEVAIGPGGKVENAQIWMSSGNQLLNQAALDAARRTVYKEPLVDGKSTTKSYLIEYVFRIM